MINVTPDKETAGEVRHDPVLFNELFGFPPPYLNWQVELKRQSIISPAVMKANKNPNVQLSTSLAITRKPPTSPLESPLFVAVYTDYPNITRREHPVQSQAENLATQALEDYFVANPRKVPLL